MASAIAIIVFRCTYFVNQNFLFLPLVFLFFVLVSFVLFLFFLILMNSAVSSHTALTRKYIFLITFRILLNKLLLYR